MFTFPLADKRTLWQGQGALFGLIPFFGGDSLGLCAGASSVWVANDAPFDCQPLLSENKDKIAAAQEIMHGSMFGTLQRLEDTAEAAGADIKSSKEYPEGIASHVILDILTAAEICSYLVAFFFKGGTQGSGGHCIAVRFNTVQAGYIMDPNYGIGAYATRSALCTELQHLLRSYVVPSGSLTGSFILKHDEFGDFVGA